jgi:hypothetical protein
MRDPVELCARAVAGWHTSWLSALGLRSKTDDATWQALDEPPLIYFGGITLTPDATSDGLLDVPGGICDSWQSLDLGPMGFRVWRKEPWYVRTAGPLEDTAPSELEIVFVQEERDVVDLEAVSVRGFGDDSLSVETGSLHPATVLDDPAMLMYLGRVDGRPVGAAMGYRTDDAVGVFGVTTVTSARGRGYGSALTRAAMSTETGLPAILAPSEEGARMYRRLGFEPVGELSIWVRADPGL